MNNYEEWSHLVARKLKGEADVIAAIEKDELDDAAATDAFVNTVLRPFLPENYGIGSGHIVDAYGRRSAYLDAITYNRNFPRIQFSGTQSDYLYESVLAAFSIRAKYVRKTFFESMDACASLAGLKTKADYNILIQLAKRNGLKPGPNKSFVHDDPLRTTRFELIGRPPAFMFGFAGIKGSLRLMQENLELWIEQRQKDELDTPMLAFPAVIATQGCFAWRNAAPLALNNREMLGLGLDDAPVRLIVLQLLHLLNRRLNTTSDGFGLKPNLGSYLSQFKAPKFDQGVGDVDQLVTLRAKASAESTTTIARDHSSTAAAKPATKTAQKSVDKPAEAPARKAVQKPVEKAAKKAARTASEQPPKQAAAAPSPQPKPEAPKPAEPAAEMSSGVFDKPSPFASAPPPPPAAEPAAEPAKPARAPVATLGSAPIPTSDGSGKSPEAVAAELDSMPMPSLDELFDDEPLTDEKPPVAALGSAPIPQAEPEPRLEPEPALEPEPPKAVIPPKPPVDIELTGENELPDLDDEVKPEPDFESTMVIAPDASLSAKTDSSSTSDFIDRVKKQMANGEAGEEPFVSTVPH